MLVTLRISLHDVYLPSVHSLMCFFLYKDCDRAIDFSSHCYSERNMRMIQIQDNISEQKNLKDKLESEQEKLHVEYNKVSSTPTVLKSTYFYCSVYFKRLQGVEHKVIVFFFLLYIFILLTL